MKRKKRNIKKRKYGNYKKSGFQKVTTFVQNNMIVILSLLGVYLFLNKFKNKGIDTNYNVDDYRLSKSKNELKTRLNSIFQSMNKVGTDKDQLFDAYKGLNKNDILYITKEFSTKPYNGWSLSDNIIDNYFFSRDLDLNGWLIAELGYFAENKMRTIYEKQNLTL